MKGWQKFLPWLAVAVFGLEALLALRPRADKDFRVREFGQLPVLLNGRVQPLDSVARNSLLQIRGQTSVPLEGNGGNGQWGEFLALKKEGAGQLAERNWWQFSKHPRKLKPTEWLLEVMTRPEQADRRNIFLIHHPELLGELKLAGRGVENSGLYYFTFADLQPQLKTIETQARNIAPIKPEIRTPYQKSVMNLNFALNLYLRLKVSLQPNTLRPQLEDFAADVAAFEQAIPAGFIAVKKQQAGEEYDKAAFDRLIEFAEPFAIMAEQAYPLIIPPVDPARNRDDWSNLGKSLLDSIRAGEIPPAVKCYAAMAAAYAHNQPEAFNRALADYQGWLGGRLAPEVAKGRKEFLFNQYQPFYRSMMIYICALLLACASWLNLSQGLRRAAFYLVVLAFIIHTAGLLTRMILEGRPPVTNLYSSAIFVGWGAALLGIILERIYRDGIGIVTASAIGFITLIIAHHLSLSGDTMEMLRAVLDTNFWLATHVVVITIGYASTFLSGFLAIVFILRGVLTRTLGEATARALNRMVYGIVCFATLFSFVGTILGGIWADQSWGRFWGWDPKENGALLIVIWNATILHARWGGLVRERGLMNLAVFGNIVTSFSWFGVNMLGIGLHSYGFMDAAFKWLTFFIASQLVIIGLGSLPLRYWASFRDRVAPPPDSKRPPLPVSKTRPA